MGTPFRFRPAILAACCACCLCLHVEQRREPDRRSSPSPNIVLILADDLGTNDVGWVNKNNANDIRTPHLDKLAKAGTKLANFYVQHICGPSRAALLTGRYPMHLGLQHANLKTDQENGVPRNESTIATVLQSHGYATYGVGKWHLGGWHRDLIPSRRGFDHWYGFLMGSQDHFEHTVLCGEKRGLDLWSLEKRGPDAWTEQPDTTQRGVYSTYLWTGRAVQLIRTHAELKREVPFFMYLAYSAVHTPLQAPESAIARFSNIQNEKRRKYVAMLSLLDEGVGNVSTALRETGLLENTVVIFFSDNGGQVQEGASNWPLRGWKGSLWEGGVRSQAFIHSPLLPAHLVGQSWGGLVHVTDVMPTILWLARAGHTGPLDGQNFWQHMADKSPTSGREEILLNIDPVGPCTDEARAAGVPCDSLWGVRNAALRNNEWKLIQRYPGDWPSHQDKWIPPPGYTPRPERVEASRADECGPCEFSKKHTEGDVFDDSQVCLFNIHLDPEERCDVAKSNPEVVQRMLQRLAAYNATAVPVRYPQSKPGRCNPAQFGNIIQWWAEGDAPDAGDDQHRAPAVMQDAYQL